MVATDFETAIFPVPGREFDRFAVLPEVDKDMSSAVLALVGGDRL